MLTSPIPAWPYPFWIAHRGAGKLAPENTLAAFRLGASYGYRAYECDVKLSADGEPFLLHDATLDRTTDGQGPANALTWDRLSRLDAGQWHGRSWAGEAPPHLGAVARYVRAQGHDLNIELKPCPGHESATGRAVAQRVLEWWQGAPRWPLLSSFRDDALAAAGEVAPCVPRALLLESLEGEWLARATRLGCRAVVTHHACLTAEVLAQVHRAGLAALVYTVNDPSRADELMRLGIDGIITDAVDRFSPASR